MTYSELGLLLGILVVWFALNRWILPSFGIQTCMSGGCCGGSCSSLSRDSVCEPSESLERPEDTVVPGSGEPDDAEASDKAPAEQGARS